MFWVLRPWTYIRQTNMSRVQTPGLLAQVSLIIRVRRHGPTKSHKYLPINNIFYNNPTAKLKKKILLYIWKNSPSSLRSSFIHTKFHLITPYAYILQPHLNKYLCAILMPFFTRVGEVLWDLVVHKTLGHALEKSWPQSHGYMPMSKHLEPSS